jgi:hypothetical protein
MFLFHIGTAQDEDQMMFSTVEFHHFTEDPFQTHTSRGETSNGVRAQRCLPGQDQQRIFLEELKKNFILVWKNSFAARECFFDIHRIDFFF